MPTRLLPTETNQDTLAASCWSIGYCIAYMNGAYAPHYPLPVISHSDPELACLFDMARWFDNPDGYFNPKNGGKR